MPPVTNAQARGIDEEDVRADIEDILGNIPPHSRTTACGDWNARVGVMHPKFGESDSSRESEDHIVNARAKWVIDLCEEKSWFILNGLQPGPPARYTYEKGLKKSCIDLVMATDPTRRVEHDPSTLQFSDHVLVKTSMQVRDFTADRKQDTDENPQNTIYKWIEGTCVQNYATSA
jgi:hypothetical protein